MKTVNLLYSFVLMVFMGCNAQKNNANTEKDGGITSIENGKVTIANPELEYEVIIMDIGFESWFATNKKPKGYYNLTFLEAKNRRWVQQWNAKAMRINSKIDYTIDYNWQTHYGYEVNYMLYHYLLYYQQVNNLKLD